MRLLLLYITLAAPLAAQTSAQCRAYLERWEGCTYHVVHRPHGEVVAGVGHNLKGQHLKSHYTKAEVNHWFATDYVWAMRACREAIPTFDHLPMAARLLTIQLAWCCGREGLLDFVAYRAALSREQPLYSLAAYEMANSKWAHQVSESRAWAAYKLMSGL